MTFRPATGVLPNGRPSTVNTGGRGVALLAPLSGPNAERGQALVQAARLALAGDGSPPLDVRDTLRTPQGAAVENEVRIRVRRLADAAGHSACRNG